MKKILEVSGVQKLTREQQSQIKGARRFSRCCTTGRGCEISIPEYGIKFCGRGVCGNDGIRCFI